MPYEVGDADYFFGRNSEVAAIIARLFANRLTIVYGSSGVGKSSILRAGVVHRLMSNAHALPVQVTEWCDVPMSSVHAALDAAKVDRLPDELLQDRLCRAVVDTKCYVMVVLDQFEELLRDARWTDSQDLDVLLDVIASLSAVDNGVSFVIALRADALADVDRLLTRLDDSVLPESYRIEPMTEENANEAIRSPVDRYNKDCKTNVTIEEGLVEAVLSGGGDTPEAKAKRLQLGVVDEIDLPFIQIVMTRVWEAERDKPSPPSDELRLETLDALGGTERIMEEHIRRILEGLTPHERETTVALLQWLITPTGAKAAYSTGDLAKLTLRSVNEVDAVVAKLSGGPSRILHTSEGTARYELSHDRLTAPVATWAQEQTAAQYERGRVAYQKRVAAIAAVVAVIASLVVGLAAARFLDDDGPPRATVQSMTIEGSAGLDERVLHDGNETEALVIPIRDGKVKIVVNFEQETEIVDIQLATSTDEAVGPPPSRAYIAETEIEVPIDDKRPAGRGAFGVTKRLVLIVEAEDVDATVQLAELKIWRREA